MNNREQILSAIYSALDSINEQREPENRLPKEISAPLSGSGGLDSIELVNLIVATEDSIATTLGQSISLADAFSGESGAGALETVGTFAHHISNLLDGGNS
jgi:hypothetical protein